jgi:hypothetical protein
VFALFLASTGHLFGFFNNLIHTVGFGSLSVMDINALLSPSESPVQQHASAAPVRPRTQPRPVGGRRTASGLSNEISMTSPPPEAPRSAPQLGQEATNQHQRNAYASSYNGAQDMRNFRSNHDTPETRSPHATPAQAFRPQLQYISRRHSSTPQMETLAGAIVPVT